jgi:hypothetical protein
VRVFVQKDQCFNEIDILHHCQQNLKFCAIHLENKICNLTILSLYRAPSGDFNQFLRELYAT